MIERLRRTVRLWQRWDLWRAGKAQLAAACPHCACTALLDRETR